MKSKRLFALLIMMAMIVNCSPIVFANEADEQEIIEEIILDKVEVDLNIDEQQMVSDAEEDFVHEDADLLLVPPNTIMANSVVLENYDGMEYHVDAAGGTGALQDAIDAAVSGDRIVIDEDIELDGELNIRDDKDVLFITGDPQGKTVKLIATMEEDSGYYFGRRHFDISGYYVTLSFQGVELIGTNDEAEERYSGGINAEYVDEVVLNGAVFKGCAWSNSSLIIVGYGHLILNECSIENSASYSESLILLGEQGGFLTMNDCIISSCEVRLSIVSVGKEIDISNTEISDCVAGYAVIHAQCAFTSTNLRGSAVIRNEGIGIALKGEANISNSTISDNDEGISSMNAVTVDNSFIENNDASGITCSALTINGSVVSGNKFGGIVADTVDISKCRVENNINGSGILAGVVNADNTIIGGNQAVDGAGIYAVDNANLLNVEISGNIASGNGGGIYTRDITTETANATGRIFGEVRDDAWVAGNIKPALVYVFDMDGGLVASEETQHQGFLGEETAWATFEVTVPVGLYNVVLHKKNHTPRVFYNVLVNGKDVELSKSGVLYIFAGDMDDNRYEYKSGGKTFFTGGDGNIDAEDLRILEDNMYEMGEDALHDLNDDDRVNASDISLLQINVHRNTTRYDLGGDIVGSIEKTTISGNAAGVNGGGVYIYKPSERRISGSVMYEGYSISNYQPAHVYLLAENGDFVQRVDTYRGQRFEFKDVPDGTYTIVAHKDNHTSVKVTDVVFDGTSIVIAPQGERAFMLYAGDCTGTSLGDGANPYYDSHGELIFATGDGQIGVRDRSVVYDQYWASGVDATADMNDDSMIGIHDSMFMISNYNMRVNDHTFAQIDREVNVNNPVVLEGTDIIGNTAVRNGGGIYYESAPTAGGKIIGSVYFDGRSLSNVKPAMVYVYDVQNGDLVTSAQAPYYTEGMFEAAVPPGIYTVIVHKKNHTPAVFDNIQINGNIVELSSATPPTSRIILWAGDMDANGNEYIVGGKVVFTGGDGAINQTDYDIIIDHMYEFVVDNPYDINDDDEVGGLDRSVAQNNMNRIVAPIDLGEATLGKGLTFKTGIIGDNTAGNDGGGIYTDDLSHVKVEEAAVFSNNSARRGFDLDLAGTSDGALHDEVIKTNEFTTPYTNAYNNYDINFAGVSVTYKANGGTGEDVVKDYLVGSSVTVLDNMFSNGSKSFKGWTDNNGVSYDVNSTFIINEDVVLNANWASGGGSGGGGGGETKYTVTFETNGGSSIQSQSVSNGKKAERPDNPTKSGYIFDGWYSDEGLATEYDFSKNVTSNITVYAKWTEGDDSNLAILEINGMHGERIIYQEIVRVAVGRTIKVTAPKLTGYKLSDDESKTVVIIHGTNVVNFKYNRWAGFSSGRLGLVLDLRNHIKYINGYPDGSVQPDGNITRAEAAAIFYRLLDAESMGVAEGRLFSDVAGDVWYAQAVNYLAENEVILGYPDGTFKPDATITRAEFAAIASRFDELEEVESGIFADVSEDHWAFSYINSAVEKGWVSGFPDSTFKPNDSITRVQVVVIVNKMLNRKVQLEDIPDNVIQFIDLPTSYWGYTDIIEASNEHDYEKKEDGYEIWK